MGLRINTNIFSLSAQRSLAETTTRLGENYSRLSSGLRIASASDDAAGLGISERMRARIRSFQQASRNAQDGISLAQTAEGALSEVSNSLTRMRELAVQSSNGTLSTTDRASLETEFAGLISEIDRIANETDFNEISLLSGDTTINIQAGIDDGNTVAVAITASTANDLGIDTLGVDTLTNATAAISSLDAAIDLVTQNRGTLGAAQNRLGSSVRSLSSAAENLSAAESRIRDVDVAAETADLTRNSILQQAAVAVLVQANSQPELAITLLG